MKIHAIISEVTICDVAHRIYVINITTAGVLQILEVTLNNYFNSFTVAAALERFLCLIHRKPDNTIFSYVCSTTLHQANSNLCVTNGFTSILPVANMLIAAGHLQIQALQLAIRLPT